MLHRVCFHFKFFCPLDLDMFPFFIAVQIASYPSTYIATDLHLDASPIKVLLEVVKCAASCEGTIQGHSTINVAS